MERPWTLDQQAEAKATIQPLTFEDLFADEHERLYRGLYLVVGNSHEAEELMQDAFVRVLEPDFERADRIGDSRAPRRLAELLIDCEEDRMLRAVLVGC